MAANNENIQPLHHSNENRDFLKQTLNKKLFQAKTNFASPTDNLMSPCSAKLKQHKQKQFLKRNKPQALSFVLAESTNTSSNNESNRS